MSVIFNGHDLDELFVCGDPEITVFNSRVNYDEADNRNGAVVIGRTWGKSSVRFTIGIDGEPYERRDKLSTLAAWLEVDEPKRLVLPDTPERYYLAIPDGEVTPTRGFGGETAELTFVITDPIAYGMTKTVTVPSGSSVTFVVGGTAPTYPTITATATRNGSSLVWGVRLDEGDFIHVATGSSSGVSVAIDNGARTLTVASNANIPTLDSDWLELTPGEHTLRMDNGTGAATVSYVERWY